MSTDLAIAGVTTVLRNVLETALDRAVSGTRVTTKPLDKAQPTESTNQVNLFLYQVTPNAAFSNLPMPGTPRGRPPLALNLHYLLTVFGADDADEAPVEAQRLLGVALRTLMDVPELTRDKIRSLAPESGLDRQIDRVRITPHTLSLEEISRSWPAFQAAYRLSAAIDASCVLIESTRPHPSPLPVLRRGPEDRGVDAQAGAYPFPLVSNVSVGSEKRPLPAARLGDTLAIAGENLAPEEGLTIVLRMRQDATDWRYEVPVDSSSPTKLVATIRDAYPNRPPPDWHSGTIVLSAVLQDATGADVHESNQVPFLLAPRITTIDQRAPNDVVVIAAAGGQNEVTVDVGCVPPIVANQPIEGFWGSQKVAVDPPAGDGPWSMLSFRLIRPGGAPPPAVSPAASLRLRVAGADSLPFRFRDPQRPELGFEMDPAQQIEVRWQ